MSKIYLRKSYMYAFIAAMLMVDYTVISARIEEMLNPYLIVFYDQGWLMVEAIMVAFSVRYFWIKIHYALQK